MSDFQQKAQLAAAKAQSLNPAEAFAQSLTCDRPTIDSAVKAFLSLTAARSLASSDPNNTLNNSNNISDKDKLKDVLLNNIPQEKCFFIKSKNPQQAALLCARQILKTINSFQIPEDNTAEEKSQDPLDQNAMEIKVIRILWNGLIKSGKKPSKILGRKSLEHVYPFILNDLKSSSINGVDPLEVTSFMEEFGMLLNAANKRRDFLNKKELDKLNDSDDDSCLLWDVDGGRAELDRRKQRRMKKVGSVVLGEDLNEDNGDGPRIETIPEGDETNLPTDG